MNPRRLRFRFPIPLALLHLLLLGLLGACSQHYGRPQAPPPAPVASRYSLMRDIAFTPIGWPQQLRLDVYRPEGAGPFPSVLLIHGGAWKRGGRDQVESLAERLAARGYLVVNTTYRLVPQYVWPAQLEDVQLALRWMASPEGAAHGIDAARIGTFGYSAGGHLAALVASVQDDPAFGKDPVRVKAVVAGGTPSDLPVFKDGKLVPALIGAPYADKPQAYVAASPIAHVSAGDPPVFIYHAGLDRLVPIEQAERYKAALDAAGIPNELFIERGREHITGFFFDGAAVDAALEFLDRHLRQPEGR